MQSDTQAVTASRKRLWTGRIISTLVVLFLLMDSVMKFVKPAPVLEACVHLGLPERLVVVLGILCLACTAMYSIPRTSFLGALLLTGYLGGAVSIHLRVGDPLFSQALFPVYMGVLVWVGLVLRNHRVERLLLFQK